MAEIAPNIAELEAIARRLRRTIVTTTTAAGSGHPSSSLSAVEIMTTLYFGGFMRFNAKQPNWPARDRFILSKGHAAPVLYAVLAEAGYFDAAELVGLRKLGSRLEGHPNMRRLPGVEASTGSLGQGLSIGVGHALAARVDRVDYRTFVLLGDGENDEGQVWEAAMSAVKYKLDNLVAIVDHNKYQQTGPTSEVLDLSPLVEKWAAFGWHAWEIDGHDFTVLVTALNEARAVQGRPAAIVAHTKKGRGLETLLSALGDTNFHGKPLSKEAAEKALAIFAD
jgi:transketolase